MLGSIEAQDRDSLDSILKHYFITQIKLNKELANSLSNAVTKEEKKGLIKSVLTKAGDTAFSKVTEKGLDKILTMLPDLLL